MGVKDINLSNGMCEKSFGKKNLYIYNKNCLLLRELLQSGLFVMRQKKKSPPYTLAMKKNKYFSNYPTRKRIV